VLVIFPSKVVGPLVWLLKGFASWNFVQYEPFGQTKQIVGKLIGYA